MNTKKDQWFLSPISDDPLFEAALRLLEDTQEEWQKFPEDGSPEYETLDLAQHAARTAFRAVADALLYHRLAHTLLPHLRGMMPSHQDTLPGQRDDIDRIVLTAAVKGEAQP